MNARIRIIVFAALLLPFAHAIAQTSIPADTSAPVHDSLLSDSIDLATGISDTSINTDSDTARMLSTEIQHADTMRDIKLPNLSAMSTALKDSTDSLAMKAARDSLYRLKRALANSLIHYPASAESIFCTHTLLPLHIYSADASALTDILPIHPAMVKIPYSLASSLGRICYFGFPSLPVELKASQSTLPYRPGQITGTDIVSAAEIAYANIGHSGRIHYAKQHPSMLSPHVLMWWETGLFDENSVNVRFARPLGRHVYLGAHSNYRYLQRGDFSQSRGGIYGFYRQFVNDTSLIVEEGTNPLSEEHISAARVAWFGKGPATGEVSYRYTDIHNDIAYERTSTQGSSLHWEERSQYAHTVSAGVRNLTLGKFGTHANAFVNSDVARTTPITDTLEVKKRGETVIYGAGLTPYVSFSNDTAAISYAFSKEDKRRYTGIKWSTIEHRAAISYTRSFAIGAASGEGLAAIGYAGIDCEDSLEHALIWDVDISTNIAGQKFGVYAKRDRMPVHIPYDSAIIFNNLPNAEPGALFDRYRQYGATCNLSYKKIGLYLGAILIDPQQTINTAKLHNYWPRGILPYEQPDRALAIAPMLGRWYGFALNSSWIFSNTKPYVKSYSLLSYHSPAKQKRQRLFIETGLNYWSEREDVSYGGIDLWHRPIYDVHTKIAVQIKTFRLYYKINNILNRKNAYVPGYLLPGLTFRWGFNWLLQG